MLGNTEFAALNHVVAAGKGGNPLATLLPVVLIGVVFYFFLIRPQRRRQQAAAKTQNSLVPGSRVMTTAGMLATVAAVEDDAVVLEIAPGVEARFVKQAIGQVLDDTTDEEEDEDGTEAAEEAETETRPEGAAGETVADAVEAKTEAKTTNEEEEGSLASGEEKSGNKPSA